MKCQWIDKEGTRKGEGPNDAVLNRQFLTIQGDCKKLGL